MLNVIFFNLEKNGLVLDKEMKEYVSKDTKYLDIGFVMMKKTIFDSEQHKIEVGMIAVLGKLKNFFYDKIVSLDINIDDDRSEILEWVQIAQVAHNLTQKVINNKIGKIYLENDIRNQN